MDIETRLTNLENLVFNFISSQAKADEYRGYDIDGCRATESQQSEEIKSNSNDVTDVQEAIAELYELIESEE